MRLLHSPHSASNQQVEQRGHIRIAVDSSGQRWRAMGTRSCVQAVIKVATLALEYAAESDSLWCATDKCAKISSPTLTVTIDKAPFSFVRTKMKSDYETVCVIRRNTQLETQV